MSPESSPARTAAVQKRPPASSLEKCSFVCHLFVVPIGLLYLVWALVQQDVLEANNCIGQDYYFPRKEYAIHLPVSAVFIFLAVPLIYAGLNSMTVPTVDSMDTLQDIHTRRPLPPPMAAARNNNHPTARRKNVDEKSTLPEICDLDPATLVWQQRPERKSG